MNIKELQEQVQQTQKLIIVENLNSDEFYIIIHIGINDTLLKKGAVEFNVDKNQFKKNIYNIIKKAKTLTKNIILLDILPVNEDIVSTYNFNTNNKIISEYNEILYNIAKLTNINIVKNFKFWLDRQKDFLGVDGLHPSAKGYINICKTISSILNI